MATPEEQRNIATVHAYLAAVDAFDQEAAASHLAPDVVQREFPNAMTPEIREYAREIILTGVREAHYFLTSQRTEVVRTVASGSEVVVEIVWAGVMRGEMGPLEPGDTLHAHGAIFFTLRDATIAVQHHHFSYIEPKG